MEAKIKKIKTKRQKNAQQRAREREIAETLGCSVKMVQSVLSGKRRQISDLGQNIVIADQLLEEKQREAKECISKLFKRA